MSGKLAGGPAAVWAQSESLRNSEFLAECLNRLVTGRDANIILTAGGETGVGKLRWRLYCRSCSISTDGRPTKRLWQMPQSMIACTIPFNLAAVSSLMKPKRQPTRGEA